jgi:hypothetical protein
MELDSSFAFSLVGCLLHTKFKKQLKCLSIFVISRFNNFNAENQASRGGRGVKYFLIQNIFLSCNFLIKDIEINMCIFISIS